MELPLTVRARILVVDDDPDGREVLQILLEKHGFAVDVATDGLDAARKAPTGRPDIALIDLTLPEFDGYQVARQICEVLGVHRMPLIALSGHNHDYRRAREAGFHLHLVKPVDFDLLFSVLDQLLAGRQCQPGKGHDG